MQQPEDSEDKDEVDEDVEEDDFVDEDYGEDGGDRKNRPNAAAGLIARTITLQMLLADRLLQPGEGAMSIEYMGQRFVGDLLADGKIRSQETNIIFATPSAWAVNCKRIINPIKRSGCGWASVRYKGRKLDAYKNIWINRRNEERNKLTVEIHDDETGVEKESTMLAPAAVPLMPPPPVRIPVKHHTIGNRTSMHDPNMLVESTSFATLGKIQPFLVSMSTNAVLIIDFHCHLTKSEVCGYLAGQWDVNAHNLSVTHAFPCRARLDDKSQGPLIEKEIRHEIEQRGLIPVGWYHSHPLLPATPSLRDIDKQLDHEMHMKGSSDSSYTPCIGVICSPYHSDTSSLESSIVSYWVTPPPENKPLEYGKPMLMSYSVVQDAHLTNDILREMTQLAEFYKDVHDFVKFTDIFKDTTTYLDKLKATLIAKFPRDQNDGILWGYIRQLVTPGAEELDEDGGIKVYEPEVTTSTNSSPTVAASAAPASSRSSSSSSNLLNCSNANSHSGSNSISSSTNSSGFYLGADMANAILAAGKLPAGTSLMSVMSGNNQNNLGNAASMFLSPVGLNLLGNLGNSSNKGNKSSSSSGSSLGGLNLNSLAALSNLGALGNLANLSNLSIANLANLSNLGVGSLNLGAMGNLANISLSNKSTSSTSGVRNSSSGTCSTTNAHTNLSHKVNNSSGNSNCVTANHGAASALSLTSTDVPLTLSARAQTPTSANSADSATNSESVASVNNGDDVSHKKSESSANSFTNNGESPSWNHSQDELEPPTKLPKVDHVQSKDAEHLTDAR